MICATPESVCMWVPCYSVRTTTPPQRARRARTGRPPILPRRPAAVLPEGSGCLSPEVGIKDVFRCPQTQRRDRQGRVGGRAGRERAAADQIKILVVVRALEFVDYRLFGIIAHPAGSHDVAGADVIQRDGFTVDFLLEPGRIFGTDLSEFGEAHFPKQEILHSVCCDESPPGIVGEIV